MDKKRKSKEEKIIMGMLGVILVCIILIILLLLSANSLNNGSVDELEKEVKKKIEDVERKSDSTGYNIADETIPENLSYSEAIKLNPEYSYKVSNENVWAEEGMTEDQIKATKVMIEQYIQKNDIDYALDHVYIPSESVYSLNKYFGTVVILNEDEDVSTSVLVKADGNEITCEAYVYDNPPSEYDIDIANEAELHDAYNPLYENGFEMDYEEFPHTKEEVDKYVTSYYSDMTEKNLYENYLNYFLPFQSYMTVEWPSFHGEFATYKHSVNDLKKRIADGDENLEKNGKISAEVTGYKKHMCTMTFVRVDVSLSLGNKKKTITEYITLADDYDKLVLIPKDLDTSSSWHYLYLY